MGFLRPLASFALAITSDRYGHGFGTHPSCVSSNLRSCAPVIQLQMVESGDATGKTTCSIHPSFNDDIIDQYDAFILDQFGVLHNGNNALDGAIELVEYLHKKGKRLIILSNTSAPARIALQKLPKYGFNGDHFEDAVTSGEESSRYIKQTYGSTGSVKKALMLTWDGNKPNNPRLTVTPEGYLEQCGDIAIATSVSDADFLLFHGSEVWYRGQDTTNEDVSLSPFIEEGSFDNVDPLLKECLAAKLPAVCANPDFIVQTGPKGEGFANMPGKLAARYEEMGGGCATFGKPGVEHFEACVRKLGLEKERVCHVGDSLHHDISGAVNAGVPVVFVTSGIHRMTFGTGFGELPGEGVLEEVMEKEVGAMRPSHVVPAFSRAAAPK